MNNCCLLAEKYLRRNECVPDTILDVGDTTVKRNETKSNTGCVLKGSLSNGDDRFIKRSLKDKIVGKCRGAEAHWGKAAERHPGQLRDRRVCVCVWAW